MVKAKVFLLAHHFDGAPKTDNFQLTEEEIPELKDGGLCYIRVSYYLPSNILVVFHYLEFLAEGVFFSVDPYMRPYSRMIVNEGSVMIGSQVAK